MAAGAAAVLAEPALAAGAGAALRAEDHHQRPGRAGEPEPGAGAAAWSGVVDTGNARRRRPRDRRRQGLGPGPRSTSPWAMSPGRMTRSTTPYAPSPPGTQSWPPTRRTLIKVDKASPTSCAPATRAGSASSTALQNAAAGGELTRPGSTIVRRQGRAGDPADLQPGQCAGRRLDGAGEPGADAVRPPGGRAAERPAGDGRPVAQRRAHVPRRHRRLQGPDLDQSHRLPGADRPAAQQDRRRVARRGPARRLRRRVLHAVPEPHRPTLRRRRWTWSPTSTTL